MNEKISAQVMSSINDAYKKGTPELKGLSPSIAVRPTFLDGTKTAGLRDYELTDHLSNVMAVISDRKLSVDTNNDNITDYYAPQVVSYTDYYPFGFPMAERSGNLVGYRFGFNGQEKDEEISGEGKSYSFKFRNYDARLGRFWSEDPLARNYTWNSTYAFAENSPISFMDLEGLEKKIAIAMGQDVAYRPKLLKKYDSEIVIDNISNNVVAITALINILTETATNDQEEILFLAIFSHGIPNSIFAGGGWENGISIFDLDIFEKDINENNIKFAENAIIYLGACNAGTSGDMINQNGETEILSFAQRLANITGANVIAAVDKVTPVVENIEQGKMEYSTGRPKTKHFYSFQKDSEPIDIGGKVDVLKLLEQIKSTIELEDKTKTSEE